MSIKVQCFWCLKDISDGSHCPHPDMSDDIASTLVQLEATTFCPDTDNNLNRGKILAKFRWAILDDAAGTT